MTAKSTSPQANVFTILSTCVIVDLKAYRNAPIDQLKQINELAKTHVIEYVEDMHKYRNKESIFHDVTMGKCSMNQIEFFVGRALTTDERQMVDWYAKLRNQFDALMVKPVPTYHFLDVSDDEVLKDYVSLGKDRITFRGQYTMGLKTAQKVWNLAKPFWQAGDDEQPLPESKMYVNASGYSNKLVHVQARSIDIGCQTIKRWIVEQIAIHYGWE